MVASAKPLDLSGLLVAEMVNLGFLATNTADLARDDAAPHIYLRPRSG